MRLFGVWKVWRKKVKVFFVCDEKIRWFFGGLDDNDQNKQMKYKRRGQMRQINHEGNKKTQKDDRNIE